jgi:hypothetical protein
MKFSELEYLAFTNSKRLPLHINIEGKYYDWVGIGWVEAEPTNKSAYEKIEADTKGNSNDQH